MSPATSTQPVDGRRFREGLRALSDRTPFTFPADSVPRHFSRAAVLLPFWEDRGDVFVAMIRRAESMRIHPGEVAFAGGLVDPGESGDGRSMIFGSNENEMTLFTIGAESSIFD